MSGGGTGARVAACLDVSLDRFTQYLCNEVLFDCSGRHYHSEIQHPAEDSIFLLKCLYLLIGLSDFQNKIPY